MKALVLSGGSGIRMRPFTHSLPKQLIPVANRPVLEHVLSGIRDLGVTEVGVVVGDRGPEIEEAIGDGSRFGARITYLRQNRPLGLAHAVAVARPFLGDDDFVLYLGDNMLPDGVGALAEEFRTDRPAAQLVVQKVLDPRAFGVVETRADGTVLRVVEKPRRPRGDRAVTGVYFFTPDIHRAVDAIEPSARGELEITDAIQWLVDDGAQVTAREYTGFWKDVGQVEDLLTCNRHLLEFLEPGVHGEVDALSDIRGPVVVEPGARIVASRITGPAIIGARTLVQSSDIGPGVSIGRDCVIRHTALADSIVLDEAAIDAAPGLRGSLIGRCATIGPAAHGGHRILAGDHARIEIGAAV